MPPRARRRAVGPPGSRPSGPEPRREPGPEELGGNATDRDDERLRADRPPHHDRA